MAEESQETVESQEVLEKDGVQEQEEGEFVPKADAERALNDMHKFKREAKEKEKKLEELSNKLKSMEEMSYKEREDYKTLYEKAKEENEELNQRYSGLKSDVYNNQRLSAVEKAAIKADIKDSALEDLQMRLATTDADEIEVEATSSGRLMVNGAEDYIARIKDLKPHWFDDKNPSNINNNPGNYKKSGDYSADEIFQMRKKDPQRYQELMRKRLTK